ncbi:hypothetical protein RYH70_01500 [Alloalcanivorax xenomutans]|uniref:hypothetical protein n=1 Tax=Alloalcanivorax xenomutans TaxID=1094342 RepID=UPI002934B349|nr:hypothetical protein [Alloalcanivorax xenomutans]WOD28742.1 hypothetical protein RYH70_01500 [Alloalcanivorax xenomutans]
MAKPKGKSINYRITVEEFERFTEEFKNESDRAAVILGASQLDILLYQMLEGHLLPNPSGKDELLDGDSPLATFSSRINICYRLGLIDAEFARALHLVRKIRNSFAHEVSGVSLSSGPHRDRIKELVAPFAQNWAVPNILEKNFGDDHSVGNQFRAVIALMSLRLDGAVERVTRASYPSAADLLPPDRKTEVDGNQANENS